MSTFIVVGVNMRKPPRIDNKLFKWDNKNVPILFLQETLWSMLF